jgi:quercetin dioxygenase-like cupin family protein
MKLVALAFSMLVVVASVAAQDPLKVASANYKLLAENDTVRVLRATLAPGATTGAHAHPVHLAVMLSGGTGRMTLGDGKTMDIEFKAEEPLLNPAGVHSVTNTAKTPMDVIIVEMKGQPGTATIPTSRPGQKITNLLTDARVVVNKVTVEPSFQESAGTTHPYDQVVIPLASGEVGLTVGGKSITSWQRGDAVLVGRGVAHETKGTKKGADVIIVAVK